MVTEWMELWVQKCDLCNRIARWFHPAGGFRCNKCPRPNAKPPAAPKV